MARTIVAFAKTISFRFQKDLAHALGIGEASVPAVRVAICTGEDESIEMRNGQPEWVGDSARRAARACQQCGPNELIVSSTIYEKIFRVFVTRPIEIAKK
jgi:class 3 adenylate cyclase